MLTLGVKLALPQRCLRQLHSASNRMPVLRMGSTTLPAIVLSRWPALPARCVHTNGEARERRAKSRLQHGSPHSSASASAPSERSVSGMPQTEAMRALAESSNASRLASATPSMRASVGRSFELTDAERQLFQFLRELVTIFRLGTVVRVAGGWVRDKLLGQPPGRIDIVLDNMTGSELLRRYVAKHRDQFGASSPVMSIVVYRSDTTKPPESGSCVIHGIPIEVGHLRANSGGTSSGPSRVATVTIATVEEDAARRDFTVNALFYNIHTDQIEDFLGAGLADLKAKRLVPCSKSSLATEPVRILRAIRFMVQFGFSADPSIAEIAAGKEFQSHFWRTTSRKLVGAELYKIFFCRDTARGLQTLFEWGLGDVALPILPDSTIPLAPVLNTPTLSWYLPGREAIVAALYRVRFGDKVMDYLNMPRSFSAHASDVHPAFKSGPSATVASAEEHMKALQQPFIPLKFGLLLSAVLDHHPGVPTSEELHVYTPSRTVASLAPLFKIGLQLSNRDFSSMTTLLLGAGWLRTRLFRGDDAVKKDEVLAFVKSNLSVVLAWLEYVSANEWRDAVIMAAARSLPHTPPLSLLKQRVMDVTTIIAAFQESGATRVFQTKRLLDVHDIAHHKMMPREFVRIVGWDVLAHQLQNPSITRNELLEWLQTSYEVPDYPVEHARQSGPVSAEDDENAAQP